MHPHPASLILLWLAFLFAASASSGAVLWQMCAAAVIFAMVFPRVHFYRLLRRSRWLLLTLMLLFGWMTPGTPLDFLPGATAEGLQLAGEHLARLVLALAALALVLNALTPVQLVAGMRTLMAPFTLIGLPHDRIAVRLALTLEEVELARGATTAADGDWLQLPHTAFGRADLWLALAIAALAGVRWLT